MLKDDIAKFFSGDADNQYSRLYETYTNDKFIDFPKFKSDNIICLGYPNSKYLKVNFEKFKKLVYDWKHHICSYEEMQNRIRNFLGECHADDDCGSEYLIYKKILTSRRVSVPFAQVEYPATARYMPYGYFVFFSKKENRYIISDEEKNGVNLDFLKVKTNRDFKAELIVSVNWKKLDSHFFANREAKLIEKSMNKIYEKDALVYIVKSSIDNEDLLCLFEQNGICAKVIEPVVVHSLKEVKEMMTDINSCRYKGVAIGKNLFVKNRITSYYNQVEIQ